VRAPAGVTRNDNLKRAATPAVMMRTAGIIGWFSPASPHRNLDPGGLNAHVLRPLWLDAALRIRLNGKIEHRPDQTGVNRGYRLLLRDKKERARADLETRVE
jgi:hypothetical protein